MIEGTVLPRRLREARLAAGVSQKQLGILAGIDEFVASPRMNQYERGKHFPDHATAVRLAKVLNIPVSYLYEPDDDLAQALLSLNKLSRKRLRELLRELERDCE